MPTLPRGHALFAPRRPRVPALLQQLLAGLAGLAALMSLAALVLWSGSARADEALPTPAPTNPQPASMPAAELFVRPAQISTIRLSPGGERIAVLARAPHGRTVLAVRPLDASGETQVIAGFADADVSWVRWINDRRLLFSIMPRGEGAIERGAALFAIDADGRAQQWLAADVRYPAVARERRAQRARSGGAQLSWWLWSTPGDGSADVLLYAIDTSPELPVLRELVRLDAGRGTRQRLDTHAPPGALHWVLDARQQLRVVLTQQEGRQRLHWRRPGSQRWTVVHEADALGPDRLIPIHLEDDTTLIVEGRAGGDTRSLLALDLTTGRLDPEPLLALAGFDVDPWLRTEARSGRVLGVQTHAAQPVNVWFDSRLQQVQQAVDAALPGRVNTLDCGACTGGPNYVVLSSADIHPGEYFHFDHATGRLRSLGERRPALRPQDQGRRSWHRVPARDGLGLPLVVTHPAGIDPAALPAGALPTLLWVNDGLWHGRIDTRWSALPQFLASRGWRVIEVDPRGRDGYGWRHFRAGWQALGTGMPDDLADAAAWAVAQGLAAPDALCVGGVGFGGHAALMAAIRHPGRFRCIATLGAVIDLRDPPDPGRRRLRPPTAGVPVALRIGDPDVDAEALRAASPQLRPAELKPPLLFSWGVHATRTAAEETKAFVDAARSAGVAVEAHAIPDAADGFTDPQNAAEFFERLAAFLARHGRPAGATNAQR